ncbi:hypothetical protein DM02DRAFT_617242 [Periconia macrospinosa]|uniref:Peptidase S54 rhomboid domain-containing protein n=1 Tax=Periconia macrospinosa TaxID=97972 RepID=A0A2V1DE97_9PLEO|nr:hypothetical protein DM02DRAFT_617242 [Periconia macrospinosa]
MTNAIPSVLRPAARLASQWNSVTLAFTRQYCITQHSCLSTARPSPILYALRPNDSIQLRRPFSTTQPLTAKVHKSSPGYSTSPANPAPLQKRPVQIGSLPIGPVDGETIRRIFGSRVSSRDGNAVLRILHHRRTSGSLADYGVDNLGVQYEHIGRQAATKAVEWLRRKIPVDEARAAEEWAEKEANRIAYNLWLADPENDSKYKDPARAFREKQQRENEERELAEQEREELQGDRIGLLHVGPSQFERNIKQQRKLRLEAITKEAEEKEARAKEDEVRLSTGEWVRTPSGTQLMKPGQETYVDIFGREQISRRKEQLELAQEKSHSGFKSEEEMLAATTLTQRLVPMTTLVLFVCILSYGFAHYYVEPSPSYRLWPYLSSSTATVLGICVANFFLFTAWRVYPLWPIMTRYFMHTPGYPRAVQALLNVFSHIEWEHFLSNTMMLAIIGPLCHDVVGRGIFLSTYICAGAVGSLFTLYWANLGRGIISSHSVGASAAIWGITALLCLTTDQDTIKIPFVKDLEVTFFPKSLFALFVGIEIASMLSRKKSTVDHASHIGGMLVGAGVAGYLRTVGFKEWKEVQDKKRRGEDDSPKTLDIGAAMSEDMKQIEEQVKSLVTNDHGR